MCFSLSGISWAGKGAPSQEKCGSPNFCTLRYNLKAVIIIQRLPNFLFLFLSKTFTLFISGHFFVISAQLLTLVSFRSFAIWPEPMKNIHFLKSIQGYFFFLSETSSKIFFFVKVLQVELQQHISLYSSCSRVAAQCNLFQS